MKTRIGYPLNNKVGTDCRQVCFRVTQKYWEFIEELTQFTGNETSKPQLMYSILESEAVRLGCKTREEIEEIKTIVIKEDGERNFFYEK